MGHSRQCGLLGQAWGWGTIKATGGTVNEMQVTVAGKSGIGGTRVTEGENEHKRAGRLMRAPVERAKGRVTCTMIMHRALLRMNGSSSFAQYYRVQVFRLVQWFSHSEVLK